VLPSFGRKLKLNKTIFGQQVYSLHRSTNISIFRFRLTKSKFFQLSSTIFVKINFIKLTVLDIMIAAR
jgi:hypothetical protein